MTPRDDDPASGADQSLEGRLERLKNALASVPAPAPGPQTTPLAQGLKGASEFTAAVLLGGAIGLGVDRLAGTRPAFSIIFFFLGVAAGVFNVVRATLPNRPK